MTLNAAASILQAFQKVLEGPFTTDLVSDVSKLPYPKPVIREAIRVLTAYFEDLRACHALCGRGS